MNEINGSYFAFPRTTGIELSQQEIRASIVYMMVGERRYPYSAALELRLKTRRMGISIFALCTWMYSNDQDIVLILAVGG